MYQKQARWREDDVCWTGHQATQKLTLRVTGITMLETDVNGWKNPCLVASERHLPFREKARVLLGCNDQKGERSGDNWFEESKTYEIRPRRVTMVQSKHLRVFEEQKLNVRMGITRRQVFVRYKKDFTTIRSVQGRIRKSCV